MKPLKNYTIIYDAECPMCALYTGVFTQYGWLEKNGRWKYSEIEKFEGCHLVDKQRSKNEIALVDTVNNRVHYGLDSMLFIVAHQLPFLKPLFENGVFQAVMKQFYYLISFNRKVIAPSSKETPESCIPDFNVFYRFAYVMLSLYLALLGAYYIGNTYDTGLTLLTSVGVFWVVNVVTSLAILRANALIYLGQLVTVLLIAVLTVLPIIFGVKLFGHSTVVEIIAFTIAGLIVLQQVIRRIKVVKRDVAVNNSLSVA